MMTLYQRWQTIADRFSEEQALLDWKSGRAWTFRQLQDELDCRKATKPGTVLFPKGWHVELIFETLRAWRDGVILCPVEGAPPDLSRLAVIPDNIAHIKMTSGSTAEPKLILFDGDQLAADADNIVATMALKREWPNLGVISMAHSYGFSNLVTPLLLHGIPLVWAGDSLPGMLATIFGASDVDVYTLPAVPAMWKAWLEAGVVNGSVVKLAISAGAPLSLELEQRLYEEAGIKVHNFYGSSECGGIAYDRSEYLRSDRACVGTAMENVELAIGAGDACLAVKSQAVGEAYWPIKANNDTTLCEGRFVTSDRAEIDASNGQVLLRDRSTDTINVAGRKVAPGRIESAILAANKNIDHCVVFGIPSRDPERVEEVLACLSVSEQQWNESETKSSIGDSLSNYEMPRHWWPCPELKPDSRGKISRRLWRLKYLERKK